MLGAMATTMTVGAFFSFASLPVPVMLALFPRVVEPSVPSMVAAVVAVSG